MPSFDHFDFAARFYENIPPAPLSAVLSDLLDIFPGARILDAGGGTGRLAQVLAQSGARLTVADFSHGMLRIALRKGGLGPTRAAVERLPFPDASFDRIVTLYLAARAGEVLHGPDIVVACEKAGLAYGHMGIFHRLDDNHPERGPIFSLANLVKPGSFDMARLGEIRTPEQGFHEDRPIGFTR